MRYAHEQPKKKPVALRVARVMIYDALPPKILYLVLRLYPPSTLPPTIAHLLGPLSATLHVSNVCNHTHTTPLIAIIQTPLPLHQLPQRRPRQYFPRHPTPKRHTRDRIHQHSCT